MNLVRQFGLEKFEKFVLDSLYEPDEVQQRILGQISAPSLQAVFRNRAAIMASRAMLIMCEQMDGKRIADILEAVKKTARISNWQL